MIILVFHYLTEEKKYGLEKMNILDKYSLDSIFFKTSRICDDIIEINWFQFVYINNQNPNIIIYKIHKNNQWRDEFTVTEMLLKFFS